MIKQLVAMTLVAVAGLSCARASACTTEVSAVTLPSVAVSPSDFGPSDGFTITSFQDVAMHAPAPFKTSARLSRDGSNLYAAIEADQPKSTLKADASTPQEVQKDDYVGLSLIVGSVSYVFFVNPAGQKLGLSSNSSWASPWSTKMTIAGDRWTADIRVPLSSVASAKAQAVRIGVFRQMQAPGGRFVYWPKTDCSPLSAEGEALITGLTI